MSGGYQLEPGGGPRVRSDIVDVYVVRRAGGAVGGPEFLQLRRATEPLKGSWHPVMGHIERSETAAGAAVRELAEETGLSPGSPAFGGFWALEQVHPYFVHQIDAVVLSPRFCAVVAGDWTPVLDGDHDAWRWVAADGVERDFMWPGQAAACREIVAYILPESSPARERLRIEW